MLCHDAPVNAAYQAVVFTGVKNLKSSGKNLRDPSSPRILLSFGSFPRLATPWHELGPAMRVAIV
ncbi:hypothetical protein Taro_023313 [Colocasia esculenta]|uniref:Uncharacterized protein n=1 Tax=Colocasia esculenta TaxID=4460 RepID=A0A843VE44_COLES|nr:hypothetical protein [Colocasia esculenta]